MYNIGEALIDDLNSYVADLEDEVAELDELDELQNAEDEEE